MTNTSECTACVISRRKIKPKEPVPHTCYRGEPGYKEPEHIIISGKSGKTEGKYYKIRYHQAFINTGRAGKYSLRRGQVINGYKIGPGQEVWVPNAMHYDGSTMADKFIWVHEEHYNQMAFV